MGIKLVVLRFHFRNFPFLSSLNGVLSEHSESKKQIAENDSSVSHTTFM